MLMLIVNVLITAINLGVLALSIKLYTEVLKDQSQNRRADAARARKEGGAA